MAVRIALDEAATETGRDGRATWGAGGGEGLDGGSAGRDRPRAGHKAGRGTADVGRERVGAVFVMAVGVASIAVDPALAIVALSGLGGLATLWKVNLVQSSIIRTTYDDDSLGGSQGHGGGASTLATAAAHLAGGNVHQGDSLAGSRLDGGSLSLTSLTGDSGLSLTGGSSLSLTGGSGLSLTGETGIGLTGDTGLGPTGDSGLSLRDGYSRTGCLIHFTGHLQHRQRWC